MKTVRVEIAVAVSSNGGWYASGRTADGNMSMTRASNGLNSSTGVARYWIEAELALPVETTITDAVVTPAATDERR